MKEAYKQFHASFVKEYSILQSYLQGHMWSGEH